jgi:hypothetical protein
MAPLNEWSAHCGGRYLHKTQQTQETNIRALGKIQTFDPTNKADADLTFFSTEII